MAAPETRHASCVACQNRAVLITGRSGQGKSALALQLMGYGCTLVGDDRVHLMRVGDAVVVRGAAPLAGLIEARGIGILQAAYQDQANVTLVVDLDRRETTRLPLPRHITLLGCDIPLILGNDGPQFAAGILQFLKVGQAMR